MPRIVDSIAARWEVLASGNMQQMPASVRAAWRRVFYMGAVAAFEMATHIEDEKEGAATLERIHDELEAFGQEIMELIEKRNKKAADG